MEVQDVSWPCLVGLFLTSLLIVLTWLVQYLLTALRLRRAKQSQQRRADSTAHHQHPLIPTSHGRLQSKAGGVWSFLLKLRSGSDGGGGSVSEQAGVRGLLASLFSFKSFREHWQRAWVRALNEQACRHGSSIQITFDSSLQLNSSAEIDSVTCTNQSIQNMVLHCKCKVDTMTFPVTVTQQSHAAVSMDTYQITLEPMMATVVVSLEEVEDEGMLVSWTLSKQPSFNLTVCPRRIQRKGSDGEVDLDMIRELVEDTLFSTQPAMVLNLKTCVSSPAVPTDHLRPPSQGASIQRLLLRHIKATFHKGGQWSKPGEMCCVLSLNHPTTESRTHFLSLPSDPPCSLEWSEDITLDVGSETKEMRVRLLERNATRERYLPGYASITLDPSCTIPSRQHVLSVSPGHGLAPSATVTLEILCVDSGEPGRCHNDVPLRSSLTPTKKVDVDRTIMPDGTIVTTVTTIHSRPKVDRSAGDSPKRSPSKVEVTENTHMMPSDGRSSTSSLSSNSLLSNGLDPVAETAIRQLTESASKVSTGSGRKTPTKRSTLIISGVSKVPLAEDDCALSVGYAAAMDAELHGNHHGAGHHPRDPEETTPSDASERPSVDDVESDTGSTGALETRSLKDHKVGFLRSGTKLLFRRRHREKEPCVSVSHEDISNLSNNCVPTATSSRKKSGSFSRRLIKRFSFRSSGKSKGKGTTTNGGESTLDN